jgi:hypothetical protein
MQELMDESHSFVWLIHPPLARVYKSSINPGLMPNGDYKLQDFATAN